MKKFVVGICTAFLFLVTPGLAQTITPFSDPTVNGLRINVTELTLRPSISIWTNSSQSQSDLQNLTPLGTMAFPQSVPAAPPTQIPGSLSTLPTVNPTWSLLTPPSLPSLAVARPDFLYEAAKLSFEKLVGSSTTGQKGLDAGPGTPTGVKRFVPVGEY